MTPRLGLLLLAALAILALGRALPRTSRAAPSSPGSTQQPATAEAIALHVSSVQVLDRPSGDVPTDGHPHPITAEHLRIQAERQLIGALNDAVDLHDVGAMRQLIARYRKHDPNDEHRMRAGYERIADCLQYPGEASRESARRYYENERASTLRRYVRRACFE